MRSVARSLLFILSLALTIPVAAQITGETLEEDGQPLPGVLVTLRKAASRRALSFGRSDSDGRFAIEYDRPTEGFWLHFRMLGFREDSIRLIPGKSHYLIRLREEVTELREVTVTVDPIRAEGDTIRYLVSNFSQIQDKSLADVLKRMPGIEVGESGQIKYQGVSINRFYIEGRDMLGGRYGVATTSINPEDVGSVEVMENHQPIKAIRDLEFSHNAAVNIRLKEDAKSRWVGTATLGGGVLAEKPTTTPLWEGKGSLMRFRKEEQILAAIGTSNAGKDATVANCEVALGADGQRRDYTLTNPFSLTLPVPAQLDEEWYRRGPTHSLSINGLRGLADEVDLTGRLNYTKRTDLSRGSSRMTYFFKDEDKIIESEEEGRSHSSELALDAGLLINKSALYLSDKLSGRLRWRDLTLDTRGTMPNSRDVSIRHREITNDLSIILPRGSHRYRLDSQVRWERQPGLMTITGMGDDRRQEISSEILYSNTSTDLSLSDGIFDLSGTIGLSTLHRTFYSDLTLPELALSSTDNQLTVDYLRPYAVPRISLRGESLEALLSIPIDKTYYRVADHEETQRIAPISLHPSLHLDLEATRRLKLSGDLSYSNGYEDAGRESGYLLSGYYTLTRGATELNHRQSLSSGIGAEYRNPLRALFTHLDLRYLRYRASLVSRRDLQGDYLLSEMTPMDNRGHLISIGGSISKGIILWQTTLVLKGQYTLGRQEMFLKEALNAFRFRGLSLGGSASSHPVSWINLTYNVGLDFSHQALEDEQGRLRRNISQSLELVLMPDTLWRIEMTGNHYYNEIVQGMRKNYLLMDLGVVYSPRGRFEVSLQARNLFNNHNYGYTLLSSLTAQSVTYDIRPMELLASIFFHF